jgi:peroxiredoxin
MRLPVTIVAAALTLTAAGVVLGETPPAPAFTPYPAPDFVVNLPDGKPLRLSSLRGKVVVVECLFTTCPHCQDASKTFTSLYKEYGARGFQPVGVAFNEELFAANATPAAVVNEFVKNFSVAYPIGWTDRSKILEFIGITSFDRFVVPQMVWIDRKGMVRAKTQAAGLDSENRNAAYYRQMIETLTKEPGGAAKKPVAHQPVHTAQK